MLHAVLRRGSYSVPREKRAATQGPIGGKRLLLGWAGSWCFSGALLFSSCPLCALVLVWSGRCGLRFVFSGSFPYGRRPKNRASFRHPHDLRMVGCVVSTVPFLSSSSASNFFGSDYVPPGLPVPEPESLVALQYSISSSLLFLVISGAPLTEQDTVESFTFGVAQALPVGLEYNPLSVRPELSFD